jgi:gamma-butyrobetaine dioxygenase
MPEIRILNSATAPVVVLRDHSRDMPLPALWLRARSPDPAERDRVTGQRLVNPHLLPDDLELIGAQHAGDMLDL